MLKKILIVLFAAIFCISGVLLIKSELEKKEARDSYEALQESMADSIQETEPVKETVLAPEMTEEEKPAYQAPSFLSELMEENPSVIGWLTIDDTNVNYPMVQNKEDNEYFLHRDINGEESVSGAIYLDSNHDLNNRGLHTVYGHHMRDGSMFKDVSKFIDADYMENHQNITIYTDQRQINLEPVYCYAALADGAFRNVVESPEDLQAFLNEKTGEDIAGDNVFVFVTCEYSHENGRIYLICRER